MSDGNGDRRLPVLLTGLEMQLMLAIAWAAPILGSQLRRLLALGHSRFTAVRPLNRLLALGLVRRDTYAHHGASDRPPQYGGHVWIATETAYAVLRGHELEPPRTRPAPLHQLDHDLIGTEVLVRAITSARAIVSGVYFAREQYTFEHSARPRIDSILMIRTGPTRPTPEGVPWITREAVPDEEMKVFALEIDRGTEPYSVIYDKALAYRAAYFNREYRAENARFPTPCWVVPTPSRLRGIQGQWQRAWPDGRWLITTDAGMENDEWQLYHRGTVRRRPLLESWLRTEGSVDPAAAAAAKDE